MDIFTLAILTILFIPVAVDCGQLPAPVNGSIFGTKTVFPNTVKFSCDEGFDLLGSLTRKCQPNGSWSGNSTTCKGQLILLDINQHLKKKFNITPCW